MQKELCVCDICGQPIYIEDDQYEGDTYYEIDDLRVCDNPKCIEKALEPHRKEAKREGFGDHF